MCGTSVDAIDAIAVHWNGDSPVIKGHHTNPIPDRLRRDLLALSTTEHFGFETLYALDAEVALCHANAANELVETLQLNRSDVLAIGFHGQTVFHAPDARHPFTVQIGDPNRLAARTGMPVVADVRRADIALGGQGAPLAPALHSALFRTESESRAVLNLGGIANLTLLPNASQPVTGFDTGPANALLDAWCVEKFDRPFDRDGELAASGKLDESLLRHLLDSPYFNRNPPKSTGRETFNLAWLKARRGGAKQSDHDVLATLTELTARTVGLALRRYQPSCELVLVCGGGRHNASLMNRLRDNLDCPIKPTDALGVDGDQLEALLLAWVARARVEGRAANLPSVTGASRGVPLGGLYLPPV